MADINKLVPFIKKWEGLWAYDPLDKGGATMMGITFRTFVEYRRIKKMTIPTISDLKNISPEEWKDVLKTMFWDKWKADEIKSQTLANDLVDWFWGSGGWGVRIPQRLLGVTEDGIVGPNTIKVLNQQDPYLFYLTLQDARKEFIDNIVKNDPSQIRFKQGWLNRINDIKFLD